MTLGEQQRLFFSLYIQWAAWLLARGYLCTWGEALRSDEQAEINALGYEGRSRLAQMIAPAFTALSQKILNNGKNNGIRGSLHELKLAMDTNLFKDGKYLETTEEWREAGEHWESLHPLCRWGGRFGDGNHVSLEYEGKK